MSIQRTLCTLLVSLLALHSFGQKIKTKKGEVFLDGVHKGYVEKERKFLQTLKLTYLDLQKDTLFVISNEYVPSAIDSIDEGVKYHYFSLKFPKYGKQAAYSFVKYNYNLQEERILEYFIDNGFVNRDYSLNEIQILRLLKNSESGIPSGIQKLRALERNSLTNGDFIVPKLRKTSLSEEKMIKIELSFVRYFNEQETSIYYTTPRGYICTEYAIRQTFYNQEAGFSEQVNLGKIVSRIPAVESTNENKRVYSVYNNKGALVANLGEQPFGNFRVYFGDMRVKSSEHLIFNQPDRNSRMQKMVNWLVMNKKL